MLLHVSLILIFSAWQWEWKAPAKNPPVIIKVNFIAEPPPSKTFEQSAPQKIELYPPAHPQALHSSPIPSLKARAPQSHVMAHPLVPKALKMTPTSQKPFKKRTAQRISFLKFPEPSGGIPPLQIPPKTPDSVNVGSRPSPVLNSLSVESIQPMKPANAGSPGLKTVAHRRTPTRLSSFSSNTETAFKTAKSIKAQDSESGTMPRHPISPQIINAVQSGLIPQINDDPLSSPDTVETQIAAFSHPPQPETKENNDAHGADLEALRGLFTGMVRQRIIGARNYPRIAQRRGQEGQPVIAFTLDRKGRLIQADLQKSSGFRLLDQAALDAVHQAAPYPEIPTELNIDTFQFKLPVSFVLK